FWATRLPRKLTVLPKVAIPPPRPPSTQCGLGGRSWLLARLPTMVLNVAVIGAEAKRPPPLQFALLLLTVVLSSVVAPLDPQMPPPKPSLWLPCTRLPVTVIPPALSRPPA